MHAGSTHLCQCSESCITLYCIRLWVCEQTVIGDGAWQRSYEGWCAQSMVLLSLAWLWSVSVCSYIAGKPNNSLATKMGLKPHIVAQFLAIKQSWVCLNGCLLAKGNRRAGWSYWLVHVFTRRMTCVVWNASCAIGEDALFMHMIFAGS